MKRQMVQKLLTSTATLLACTLLIGNIPVSTPTDEEGNSIVIELPSSDDSEDNTEISILSDKKPWGDPDE